MRKYLVLAAFAAAAFVAAPAAAPAQDNPLSPQTGVGTTINCILTCPHHEHSWWTGGNVKHPHKKWKHKFPKHSQKSQPAFRGPAKAAKFGKVAKFGKAAKFGRAAKFGNAAKFGKAAKFARVAKFGKYAHVGRNVKFASLGKGPSFGFGKAAKFGKAGKFGKFGKFGKHVKPHKVGRSFHKSSHGFPFYVGAAICTAAGPMINAALGGPEPTSEEMLEHMLGCFVPPIGIALMIRDLTD